MKIVKVIGRQAFLNLLEHLIAEEKALFRHRSGVKRARTLAVTLWRKQFQAEKLFRERGEVLQRRTA